MWYLKEFEENLRSRQLGERTTNVYLLHVGRFVRYAEENQITTCKAVSDETVTTFIHEILDMLSLTPGWKYVALLYLKRYFAFLVERSLIFYPPFVPAKKPRYRSGSYKALEKGNLQNLLDEFPTDKDSDIMAKAILELGYSAALRPGEIRRLKIEDIDYQRRMLFIEQSKGKKDRTVPVGEIALRWLRRYVREVRPDYLKDSCERRIFIGMRTGQALSDRAFTEFLSYRLKRAGFEHFSPHQLRASAATHMVEEGLDAGHLQQILGYQRLNTTKIYVQLQTDSLKKVLATAHPRVLAEKNNL